MRARPGSSRRHGPHQVPQKLRSVTRPASGGGAAERSAMGAIGSEPSFVPMAGWGGELHPLASTASNAERRQAGSDQFREGIIEATLKFQRGNSAGARRSYRQAMSRACEALSVRSRTKVSRYGPWLHRGKAGRVGRPVSRAGSPASRGRAGKSRSLLIQSQASVTSSSSSFRPPGGKCPRPPPASCRLPMNVAAKTPNAAATSSFSSRQASRWRGL